MAKVIRPGTTEYVLIDTRIRNAIVTEVANQDSITVRLGGASRDETFTASRAESTKTRGTLFVED
jgi:hypothetical protein